MQQSKFIQLIQPQKAKQVKAPTHINGASFGGFTIDHTVKSAAFLLLAASFGAHAYNLEETLDEHGKVYIGAGVGVSSVKPKIVNVDKLTVKEKNDLGYKINFGYRFTPNWALELSYNDLGAAIMDGSADASLVKRYGKESELSYNAASLGALYYPQFGSNGFMQGGRFNYFVELGVSKINNKNPASAADKSGLPFERKNAASLLVGAGVEYELFHGISARLMAESFASDAALLSIGINFQPHYQHSKAKPVAVAEPEAPIVIAEPVVIAEPEVIEVAPPVPAPKPAPAPKPVAQTEIIKATVFDWARAWAQKDIPAYLNSYIDGFNNDDNHKPNAAAWRQFRTKRLSQPQAINLEINNLKVTEHADNTATAVFDQVYSSNLYKDSVVKELQLRLNKATGKWQITSEKVLNKR